MAIYPEFEKPKFSYKGVPSSPYPSFFPEQHSMLIVGVREKETFLVQNWWDWKQFVEIDYTYLWECESVLHFVRTTQTTIPTEFTVNIKPFAECVDKPETSGPKVRF
eukprot:c14593_g1_i1.p2 GENE.c14593_g1_i1~~c14593_g1_i1.p2  ORF type:complete len:107 (-),score=23.28 c14593_g1_i1:38-358(-)